MSSEYKKMAEELGLKIMYSDLLDKLLKERDELEYDLPDGVGPFDRASDETIVCDRDEGYVSAVLSTISVCLKNPGRKAWVIGFSDDGYSIMHIFAADSVKAATARVRENIKACKRAKGKAA